MKNVMGLLMGALALSVTLPTAQGQANDRVTFEDSRSEERGENGKKDSFTVTFLLTVGQWRAVLQLWKEENLLCSKFIFITIHVLSIESIMTLALEVIEESRAFALLPLFQVMVKYFLIRIPSLRMSGIGLDRARISSTGSALALVSTLILISPK